MFSVGQLSRQSNVLPVAIPKVRQLFSIHSAEELPGFSVREHGARRKDAVSKKCFDTVTLPSLGMCRSEAVFLTVAANGSIGPTILDLSVDRLCRDSSQRRGHHRDRSRIEVASVGIVPDLAFTFAGRAFDRIDSVTRLDRLRNRLDARSIAGRADTLFDLRLHVEPFWPRLNWAAIASLRESKGAAHARPRCRFSFENRFGMKIEHRQDLR